MQTNWSPHTRTERLIAIGRIALALAALLALIVDPHQPAEAPNAIYGILGGYIVLSLGVVLLSSLSVSRLEWTIAIHVADLAMTSCLIAFTGGRESPFFIYYFFSLFVSTLRFRSRATVATGTVALAMYVATGLLMSPQPLRAAIRDGDFLIRSVGLVVATMLLLSLGEHQRHLQSDFAKLAAWPRTRSDRREDVLPAVLQRSTELLAVAGTALTWEDSEEPFIYVARWRAGGFSFDRKPPNRFVPLIAPPFETNSFIVRRGTDRSTTLRLTSTGIALASSGNPVHRDFLSDVPERNICSAPIEGENLNGRVFFFDDRELSPDDLLLSEIVARLLASRLDQLYFIEKMQGTAITEERVRLSRDLHDGVLQSLTGAAYQLETLHRLIPDSAESAKRRVAQIQEIIASDQRELRSLILQLRPRSDLPTEDTRLVSRLSALAERFERQWGLDVELRTEAFPQTLSPELRNEIFSIVSEAVANVAKHADATRAVVEIGSRDDTIRITVADNGKGFPFKGRYDLSALTSMKRGPVTLKERIASLGGELVIESSDHGAFLEIEVPAIMAGV
ncbi:MAG: sensor histidine kinase [Thermoanaerobaculia bacterium]